MLSHPETPAKRAEIRKYLYGTLNNSRDAIIGMRAQRLPSGAILQLPTHARAIMERVFLRWAKALHYRETGRIVGSNARIITRFYTNTQRDSLPQELFKGKMHSLQRNGKQLDTQILYWSLTDLDDDSLGSYTIFFRHSFAAVMAVDIDHKLDAFEEPDN